ncbi:transposase [Moraxella osloensis]|uniref:transposase n=1 Tax=Faucicola osloensis TaxID=34062 RepID=UPI002003D595|nr:transposase [Moraxella osloensis]MCK6053509.1 transposase [Moraxella osloensis]
MATNKPKRKTYSDEFKEFLVQEAISSGRSIASIARDNGINQNLLHNWKREQKAKQVQTDGLPVLIDNNSTNNNRHSSLSVYSRTQTRDCKIFCVNPILTPGLTQEYLHERINRSFA